MKSLILTGFDDVMAPIGELTSPLMLSYASKQEMDFLCVRQYPTDVRPYWTKLQLILNAFDQGYESVLWLDADQMITNPDKFLPDFSTPFTASLDWGADAADESFFSMCGFVAKPESRFLFEWILNHWLEYVDGDFPEQNPMRHLYRTSQRAKSVMGICPRRSFNAVPQEVSEGVQEPWQPGDFCAHLTHVSFERRVELFYEIRNQITP